MKAGFYLARRERRKKKKKKSAKKKKGGMDTAPQIYYISLSPLRPRGKWRKKGRKEKGRGIPAPAI